MCSPANSGPGALHQEQLPVPKVRRQCPEALGCRAQACWRLAQPQRSRHPGRICRGSPQGKGLRQRNAGEDPHRHQWCAASQMDACAVSAWLSWHFDGIRTVNPMLHSLTLIMPPHRLRPHRAPRCTVNLLLPHRSIPSLIGFLNLLNLLSHVPPACSFEHLQRIDERPAAAAQSHDSRFRQG